MSSSSGFSCVMVALSNSNVGSPNYNGYLLNNKPDTAARIVAKNPEARCMCVPELQRPPERTADMLILKSGCRSVRAGIAWPEERVGTLTQVFNVELP
jgi:hypothetical protein